MQSGHDPQPVDAAPFQAAYADAALSGDAAAAERVVREAIEAGLSEVRIDEEVIAPVLRMVGDLWATGQLDVAEEHRATEISIRVLALQREAFRVASRRRSRRVLLAAVEGEQHTVGLRMAADLLLHAGYDVRLLGANVPLTALREAVARHRPAVVGLSVTLPSASSRVDEAVGEARAADPGVGIVVGGAGAEDAARHAQGVAVCTYLGDAVAVVDALAERSWGN